MSRSALGQTTIALLPPSSSRLLPIRPATLCATAAPMRVLPVALTSGTSLCADSVLPISAPPISTCARLSGHACPAFLKRATARSKIFAQARAVNGVFSEGFQITGSPQTSASAAFHDHTATGKLNAVITATGPSGCHVSRM